jgi:hypothetical protein
MNPVPPFREKRVQPVRKTHIDSSQSGLWVLGQIFDHSCRWYEFIFAIVMVFAGTHPA